MSALRRAAARFLPKRLSGLVLWLSAASIGGLADGDPVATWPDLSGKGNRATQGTTAAKPLYKVGIANGKPGILFDGVDDFLSLPAAVYNALQTGNKSVFVAAKWVALGSDKRLWSTQNSGGSNRSSMGIFDATAYQFFYSTGAAQANLFQSAGSAPSTSVTQILELVQTAPAIVGRVNGTAMASANDAGNEASGLTGAIGANGAGSGAFANAYVLEMIAYNRALSASEALAVRRYLGSRYGVAVV